MESSRDWTVLFIGGASGSGKSSAAHELGRLYGVNVMRAGDVFRAVRAMTSKEAYPAIHYWSNGINWMDIGVNGNVQWLFDVSKELVFGLKAIVESHLGDDMPIIIEGDFLNPQFTASFENTKVKSIFIHEPDKNQLLNNYLAREGGEPQDFRADISVEYGKQLSEVCINLGIKVIEARPWNTIVLRILEHI